MLRVIIIHNYLLLNCWYLNYTKGTFKKYVRFRFPSFDHPIFPLLFALVRFQAPHSPSLSPQGTFVLARTRPLWWVLVSFVELNVSFKKPQWNLYKVDTIGAWQKWPLYGDVSFLVSPSKNLKSSKVNMKSTICHDFQVQIYWKEQKPERLKKT